MSEREEKFTPGEWTGNEQGLIWANGDVIAQVYDNPDTGNDPIGEEESDFNKALICAAPDLYAACKLGAKQKHLTWGCANRGMFNPECIRCLSDKALTKAKGTP